MGGCELSYRLRWALGMTLFGLAVAALVFVATDSVWWAIVGLLVAGPVATAVVRPRRT